MKKYLLVLFLIVFIVPSVVLASWWNPLSWFNNWSFNKKEINIPQAQVINIESPSTPTTDLIDKSEETIKNLQAQINDLKKSKPITIIKEIPAQNTPTPVVKNESPYELKVRKTEECLARAQEDYDFVELQLIKDSSTLDENKLLQFYQINREKYEHERQICLDTY